VRTSAGTIATRAVVLATGAWGRELAAPLGLELPIALRRLQVAVLRQPPGAPRPSAVVSDAVTNVVVRPAGGRDFCAVAYHGQQDVEQRDDCDERADAAYEATVRRALGERFPALAEAEWVGGWAGTYDHTPDWHPLVGSAPGVDGLWLTLGWSGHGFKSAPAVGRVLADLVLGREPEIDVADLAADRFERDRAMPLAYGPGARA
jgi:sarcosine oxidase, subunit beta